MFYIILTGDSLKVLVTSDVERIWIVKNCNTFYLWKRLVKPARLKHPPKTTTLEGRWYEVDVSSQVNLPDDGREAKLDNLCLEQVSFNCSTISFEVGKMLIFIKEL